MNSVRFSSEANRDILEISSYIFDLNPSAAHRFLDAIDETCDLLAVHPRLGRLRPELGKEVRSFPVGKYLLFYRVAREGVEIDRIIYGGRDLPGVFKRS